MGALLGLALAGCGSGAPGSPPPSAAARLDEGARVFSATCSGCHTLAPGPSPQLTGGGLRDYRLTPGQVAGFVRVMPLPRRLSAREVEEVSSYVAHVERGP